MIRPATVLFTAVLLGSCGPKLNYPMGAQQIQDLVERNRLPELRRHAWNVMETVIAPTKSGLPLFQTWDELGKVYPSDTNKHGGILFTVPVELRQVALGLAKKKDESLDPSCDTIPCQLVYFNPSTVRDLNRQVMEGFTFVPKCKDSMRGLAAHLAQTPLEKRDIPGFAPDSIVVKSLWVIMNSAATLRLRVYDPATVVRATPYVTPWSAWKSCVGVRANDAIPKGEASDCGSFAHIDDFYHFEVDPETVAASTSEIFQESLPPGSHTYALLLGMHVVTKEIPDWVWATFWWGDRSKDQRYSKDKPATLARNSPWNRYAMDVTYDMNRPETSEGVPNICFNPFLEGQLVDGAVSNCMTCHRRAAIGANPGLIFRGKINVDDTVVFDSYTVRTDFLWTPIVHGIETCSAPK